MYFTVFTNFTVCILSKCILSIIIRLSEDTFGSQLQAYTLCLDVKRNGIIRIHAVQKTNEMYINRKKL